MTGGTLTGSTEFLVGIDQNGAPTPTQGLANLIDGTIATANMAIGRNGGNGILNAFGGRILVSNELNLGGGGGIGELNVDGGNVNVNGWTTLGRDGGNGNGTINVSNGGIFTHNQTGGGDLLLGWTPGSKGTVNVTTGGKVTYNWWVRLAVDPGSEGTLTIDGEGSEFAQAASTDTRFSVGEGGTGNLNVNNGGRLIVANGLGVGWDIDGNQASVGNMSVANGNVRIGGEFNIGYNQAAQGTVTMDGGTISSSNFFVVGRAGNGTYSQISGHAWTTDNELRVGNDASGVGVFNMVGGSFQARFHAMIGEAGNGTLNLDGGYFGLGCDVGTLFIGHLNGSSGKINMTGGLITADAGSVEFNTQGGALVSTFDLNGGVLDTNFINNPTGNSTAQFNIDGGTIRAASNEADYFRGFASSQVSIGAGGLTFDTDSSTVTINMALSGAGGLTKSGFGQLNLVRNQLYTGNTTVRSGILNLDFTNAVSPNDIVANAGLVLGGGTLRVTTSAAVNIQNFTGTTINSGASRVEVTEASGGTGVITLGALARTSAGGTVDFSQPAVGAIATTTTNTNGILGGYATVNGVTWALNDGSGKVVGLADAAYDLGAFTAAKNFDTLRNGGGIVSGGSVNSLRFGRNAADTIGLNSNLVVGSGGILVSSAVGANGSTIGSAAAETLTSGNGQDLVVIQNNTGGNLVIGSQITGAIGLTKSGPGTLVLGNSANDYTGGTYINAGVIAINADSALGDVNGDLTFAANTLNSAGVLATLSTMTLAPTRAITLNSGGGGFSVAGGTTLTINQAISGDGGLAKIGAGTLVLGGANTYAGDTAIFEGDLQVTGSVAATGQFQADGDLNVTGPAASITLGGALRVARLAGSSVDLSISGTGAFIQAGDVTIGGAGNGTATLSGGGVLTACCGMIVGHQGGSSGNVTINADSAVFAQQSLVLGQDGGASGTVTVTDGDLSVGGQFRVGGNGTGLLTLNGDSKVEFGTMDIANNGTGTVEINGTSTFIGRPEPGKGYINVGSGNTGPALVRQTGGTASFNSWMTIGYQGGSNDPANSQYVVSGGTLTSNAGIEVGTDHGGTLNISGTAAVNVGAVSIGTYGDRGSGTAGNGLTTISGGSLTANEINVGHNANNGGMISNGVFAQTGGNTTVNGTFFVARNTNTTGTANLGGGTLSVNSIQRGGGTAALNFNGTTIRANRDEGNFINNFDASNSEVQAGGAIFDTNGHSVKVATSLDGPGALTKLGLGTLTVSGTSAFAGGVQLNEGTLSIRNDNALGTGTLVANGGTHLIRQCWRRRHGRREGLCHQCIRYHKPDPC